MKWNTPNANLEQHKCCITELLLLLMCSTQPFHKVYDFSWSLFIWEYYKFLHDWLSSPAAPASPGRFWFLLLLKRIPFIGNQGGDQTFTEKTKCPASVTRQVVSLHHTHQCRHRIWLQFQSCCLTWIDLLKQNLCKYWWEKKRQNNLVLFSKCILVHLCVGGVEWRSIFNVCVRAWDITTSDDLRCGQ